MVKAHSSEEVNNPVHDLYLTLQMNGYSDFAFEVKFIKREDFRPLTHLKTRPPMIQKNLINDELSERSFASVEEYEVREEHSDTRQELYHVNKRPKVESTKLPPVSASPSSVPVMVPALVPRNSVVQHQLLRIQTPHLAQTASSKHLQGTAPKPSFG